MSAVMSCATQAPSLEQEVECKDSRQTDGVEMDLTQRMHDDAAEVDCVEDPLAGRIVCAQEYLESAPPPRDAVIEGLVDAGDKLAIYGKSKMRKTWLLLHLAASIALGYDFIGFLIPMLRKVLFVNPEVRPVHMHRRTQKYALAAGVGDLSRLCFFHTRGTDASWADIHEAAERTQAEVICIDSIYKFLEADENSTETWTAACREMDVLAEKTGALVAYTHHDVKGTTAGKSVVDRGSGSGVAGRDYDACIALSAHKTDEYGIVAEFVARNYAPPETRSLVWNDGLFELAPDLPIEIETNASKLAKVTKSPPLEQYYPSLLKAVESAPLPRGVLEERLRTSTGLAEKKVRTLITNAVHEGIISKSGRIKQPGGAVLYGLPQSVEAIESCRNTTIEEENQQ